MIEAAKMIEALRAGRDQGLSFELAWAAGIRDARRGRTLAHNGWREAYLALGFAREAYRRAYEGEPPTRQDLIAAALQHALEHMLDDSDYAEPTLVQLMEAA